jgi:hypothetical protein
MRRAARQGAEPALAGTVRDKEAIYAFLDRLGRYAIDGFSPHEDAYVETLSMSDPQGTNPTDAAARHNAIMMAAEGAPAVPARRPSPCRQISAAREGPRKGWHREGHETSEPRDV